MKDIIVLLCKIKVLSTYHHVKRLLNMHGMIEDVLAGNCANLSLQFEEHQVRHTKKEIA